VGKANHNLFPGRGRSGITSLFRPVIAFGIAAFLLISLDGSFAGDRQILNFNPDWKFIQADPAGASAVEFADEAWATVSAPHTYNDRDTFDDWSLSGHRGEQNQWGGRTWYRKTFTLPESFRGRKVFIEFEAVRQVAEVYLNGKFLGVCKTGFTPFGFDLTPHLRFTGPNVLAVMCDNRFMKDPWAADGARANAGRGATNGGGGKLSDLAAHFNSLIPERLEDLQADQIPWNNPHWHPAHGGIYRNVYLHVTDPLHITLPLYSFLQTAGPYVYAREVSARSAGVTVEVPLENGRAQNQRVAVRVEIIDQDGQSILTLRQQGDVGAGAKRDFKLSGVVPTPKLWAPAYPHIYRVICSVRAGGELVDSIELPLGIRSMRWDAKTGFQVNEAHLKLRGWGQKPTDEWPGMGAAHPDWLHHFTLQMMKDAGGNFVRWGHCAGGPASIKAADQLGLITVQPGVDGEADTRGAAWQLRAAAFRDVLIYFRNHPAIAIWEGGNQKVTREHAHELRALMNQFDPHGGRAYAHRRADPVTAEFMEVGIGTEGGREIARLPVVEGEYNREESPRRVWDEASPPNFGYPEAKGQTYHLTSEQFAVNQVAQFVRKLGAPEHAGGANWVFSDSTSGGRVACEVARTSGEVDGVRLPKEAYHVARTMFRADPQVHMIGHWNYPAGTTKDVFVVANGEQVELFVNGKSLGNGSRRDQFLFTFPNVPWAAGEIKAVALVGNKMVATQVKRTAGAPVALRLTPITGPGGWRADGADVALVDVEAVDANGERCPTLERRVDFESTGPARWLGGYESGRTNSIFQTHLKLECGINRVALRAGRTPGVVRLTVLGDGLQSGSVTMPIGEFQVAHGFSPRLPQLPPVKLPESGRDLAAADLLLLAAGEGEGVAMASPGQFIRRFSYSGPAAGVRVTATARAGELIYTDRDYRFADLPGALRGSDYIQAANADTQYNAVDLMEVGVRSGTTVFLAHDDRVARPGWLGRLFRPTDLRIQVQGSPMTVYQYHATEDESLTLGANADSGVVKTGNMYVVFVNDSRGGPQAAPSIRTSELK
jgi:beta-galactosidase